jgi:DNA polymerase III epsilon subunit-like protein
MIAAYWPAWFRQRYGGRWPRDYLAFDVETTGLSLTEDLVVEWGHCLVRDTHIVDQATVLIDWTSCVQLDQDWLVARLDSVRRQLEAVGRRYSVTWQRLRQEGIPPAEAFAQIDELLTTMRQHGGYLVAHNGYGFDEPMLLQSARRIEQPQLFQIGDDALLDTQLLEKASQVAGDARVQPQAGETLRQYFTRLRALTLPGVRSNLDTHCYQKYFAARGIDRQQLHQAAYDAYCCHVLMEIWRELADAPPSSPPPAGQKVSLTAASSTTALIRYRGQRNN